MSRSSGRSRSRRASEHEGECQLDLDLQSLDDIQITKKEEDTEETSDEAIDSYLKGKKK